MLDAWNVCCNGLFTFYVCVLNKRQTFPQCILYFVDPMCPLIRAPFRNMCVWDICESTANVTSNACDTLVPFICNELNADVRGKYSAKLMYYAAKVHHFLNFRY